VSFSRFNARDGRRHAFALERRQRRLGTSLRVDARLTRSVPIEASLLVGDVGIERCKTLVRVVPIHVAERDDVLGREVDQVGASLSADADGGDVEAVARRGLSASETWRGTMAKPAVVAATFPTNWRLEIWS